MDVKCPGCLQITTAAQLPVPTLRRVVRPCEQPTLCLVPNLAGAGAEPVLRLGRAPGSQPSAWRRTGARERPEIAGQREAAEAVQRFYAQKANRASLKSVSMVSLSFPIVFPWFPFGFLFAAENHTRRQPSTSR